MWTTLVLGFCLVAPLLNTATASSCSGRCGTSPDSSKTCQCNSVCSTYNDCCSDYTSVCTSCSGRCSETYNRDNPCHCNDVCGDHGNCCSDYNSICLGSGGENSCEGRCSEQYNSANPCHCNDLCKNYGNCCSDYDDHCSVGGTPTPGGMSALFEAMWNADINRLDYPDLVVDIQAQLDNYQQRIDESPLPLFGGANEDKLLTGTWPSFRALLDNYNVMTGDQDTTTSAETAEIDAFLDQALATEVMQLAYQYLNDRGHFTSMTAFRQYIKNAWFTLYTRSSGVLDSSGFEHVFVGEVKNGKVSGYHNWYAFYLDEKDNVVNYYGYTSKNTPNQILMQFTLDAGSLYYKELASILYGASPEFELAIFTVCFVTNPNALTTFTFQGATQRIQTWDYTGGYIGSAYFSV